MSHHYTTRLHEAAEAKQTPVLVGLDPRLDQLPPDVLAHARELYDDPAAQAAAGRLEMAEFLNWLTYSDNSQKSQWNEPTWLLQYIPLPQAPSQYLPKTTVTLLRTAHLEAGSMPFVL